MQMQMETAEDVIAVLTAKSVSRLLKEGGSSSWALDRNHAAKCKFIVCVRNRNADWVDVKEQGKEPHGSAFWVGRIVDVCPSPETAGRWLVKCDEYATVQIAGAWKGWRNPVRYTSLRELGIDEESLVFQPMPQSVPVEELCSETSPRDVMSNHEHLVQAKRQFARILGLRAEMIEVVIRV